MVLRPWVRRARLLAGSPATAGHLGAGGRRPACRSAALCALGAHRAGPRRRRCGVVAGPMPGAS